MSYQKKRDIHAIIPAAGSPTNKIISNVSLPDTMIPINGQPVIGYIIEDLFQRNITHITVVLSASDTVTEGYITKKFGNKPTITVVYNTNPEKGIGHSLFLASKVKTTADSTLIYLGDTIYKGKLTFKHSFLVMSKIYEEPEKWCFVETKDKQLTFINKPKMYKGNGSILSGLYYFHDAKYFHTVLQKLENSHNFEVKDILEAYVKKYDFQLVQAEKWYDCGNIENFYKAKIDFLKLRKFNKIDYNDLYGYVTKSGKNKEKLFQEINWYINTPHELQIFSPRLIDYQTGKDIVQYSNEFYGYPALSELFVFNSLDLRVWKMIIARLFTILSLFKKYKTKIPYVMYEEMYINKTQKRLEVLREDIFWKKLLDQKTITINGKAYNNVSVYMEKINDYIKKLYQTGEMTFIHGDLCLSNILFDPSSRIFKFIDPGGRFGQTGVYGDIKYDVAKLRHSFSGKYDFIKSNLFELQYKENEFTFTIYNEDIHTEISSYFDQALIKNGFSLEKVKMIESLLFLSMIPLHSDNRKHQLAMYCRALQLLQENFL